MSCIYVTTNNENHLMTKKLISRFLQFLTEILMGNSIIQFSGHKNMILQKVIAISAEAVFIWSNAHVKL